MLKTSEMTLKLAQNRVSFGLNGSHKARKPNAGKGPGFCPPPDISKDNGEKDFGPILAAHDHQNGHKLLADKNLRNRTFPKKHNVLDRIYKV